MKLPDTPRFALEVSFGTEHDSIRQGFCITSTPEVFCVHLRLMPVWKASGILLFISCRLALQFWRS